MSEIKASSMIKLWRWNKLLRSFISKNITLQLKKLSLREVKKLI